MRSFIILLLSNIVNYVFMYRSCYLLTKTGLILNKRFIGSSFVLFLTTLFPLLYLLTPCKTTWNREQSTIFPNNPKTKIIFRKHLKHVTSFPNASHHIPNVSINIFEKWFDIWLWYYKSLIKLLPLLNRITGYLKSPEICVSEPLSHICHWYKLSIWIQNFCVFLWKHDFLNKDFKSWK